MILEKISIIFVFNPNNIKWKKVIGMKSEKFAILIASTLI